MITPIEFFIAMLILVLGMMFCTKMCLNDLSNEDALLRRNFKLEQENAALRRELDELRNRK